MLRGFPLAVTPSSTDYIFRKPGFIRVWVLSPLVKVTINTVFGHVAV